LEELSFEFQEDTLSIEPVSSADITTTNQTMQLVSNPASAQNSAARRGTKRRSALYLFTNLLPSSDDGPPTLDISLTDKPKRNISPEAVRGNEEVRHDDIFSPDLHRNDILQKSSANLSKFFNEMFQEDVEIIGMEKITLRRSKRKRTIASSQKRHKSSSSPPSSPYVSRATQDSVSRTSTKSPAKKVTKYKLRSKTRPMQIVEVVPVTSELIAQHQGSGDSSDSPTKSAGDVLPPKAFRTVTFNRKVTAKGPRMKSASRKSAKNAIESAAVPARRSKRIASKKT